MLLLLPVFMIIVLFLVEFAALIKLVDYRTFIGPYAFAARQRAERRTDPELLVVNRPYVHYVGSQRGGEYNVGFWRYDIPRRDRVLYSWDERCDHNGFRNAVDLKSADIAVIGDSMVEGMTIPDGQLMTTLLAHLQGKTVANLGQNGYGPEQELVVLKRYAAPLRPRTIVWMFYEGNDLSDVLNYRRIISGQGVGAAALWMGLPERNTGFWQGFYERSFTKNALDQLIVQLHRRPPGAKRSGVILTSNGKEQAMYFVLPPPRLTPQNLDALDQTLRDFAAGHALCAAQGARLIVVFLPEKFRVFRQLCRFPPESECRNWVVCDLPERMEKGVRAISSEIGYLDLTPFLMNGVKRGVVPYYTDDEHMSPEGHQIAAAAINNYLSSTPNR